MKLIFDRKNQADEYGDSKRKKKGLLQVEIYYGGKRIFLSTGVKLFRGQWHDMRGVINHPDAVELNAKIRQMLQNINDEIVEQMKQHKSFSLDFFKKKDRDENNLIDAIMDIRENEKLKGKRPQTIKNYSILISWLQRYGKIWSIDELTRQNVQDFQNYLATQNLKNSSVNIYMYRLSTVCNKLYLDNRLPENPCAAVAKLKEKNAKIKYLTEQELDKLKAAKGLSKAQRYALDFFLVQTMTGLAFADLCNLNIYRDVEQVGEKYIVRKTRQKTGSLFTIQLMEQPYQMIKQHGGQMNKIMYVANLNAMLHRIGNNVIGRPLTSHMGRHTFATWALSHGVPIEYVSKMLGHADIMTTQKYAKVLQQDVLAQFDKLEDALKKQ